MKNPISEAMKYDGDRESSFEIGRLGSSSARIEAIKQRMQLKLLDKCSNPSCAQPSSSERELSECASCHTVRYCGRDCQLAHWPDHKAICKEKKKEIAAKTEEQARMARELLGHMDALTMGTNEDNDRKPAGDAEDAEAAGVKTEVGKVNGGKVQSGSGEGSGTKTEGANEID